MVELDTTRTLTAEQRASAVGAQLFAQKGYAETTTRELARALNITNGTFYHHFRTKEELLRRICEESLSRITMDVRGAVATASGPAPRVEALVRAHVRAILDDQDRHTTMLTQLRSLRGDNLVAVLRMRDEYEQLVVAVVADAQRGGALRSDIGTGTLALLLLNLLNWTIFWYRPGGDLTAETLADRTIALFLDGAATRS